MRKYYVFENDWDVQVFEDRGKALEAYGTQYLLMTKEEKERLNYFRVYEIEIDQDPSKIEGDLMDYMTEMLARYR